MPEKSHLERWADVIAKTPSRAHEASGWLPFETAPRTGEWFLAYRGESDFGSWDSLVPVAWSARAEDFIWPDHPHDPYRAGPVTGNEKWIDDEDFYEARGSFTHWMPMPVPPQG